MLLALEKGKKNPILRGEMQPVKRFDKALKKLTQDMEETMFETNGVGLAAPQIGKNMSLALVRLNVETKSETILVMANPEIIETSGDMIDMEEGCLSLPGKWGTVPRHSSLTVAFQNVRGEKQVLCLEGFNARIVQHEVDHLNGKLFIDRAIS